MNEVLLVNDKQSVADRMIKMLNTMGWSTTVATTEAEVYESCVASKPAMAIVDVEMDSAAAFDCMNTARIIFPEMFIIAVTRGGTDKLWPGASAICGANRYIPGLASSSKLAEAIDGGISQGLVNYHQPSALTQPGRESASAHRSDEHADGRAGPLLANGLKFVHSSDDWS